MIEMENTVDLLSINLLDDKKRLKLIDYWLRVMDRLQGWHYDLDIIWILKELEKSGIKKGDTILDAGGGMGVTQFILAALGFNVISLDFSKRYLPQLGKGIFDIQLKNQESIDYKHDYINYIKYGNEPKIGDKLQDEKLHKNYIKPIYGIYSFLLKVIITIMKRPKNSLSLIKRNYNKIRNKLFNIVERKSNHKEFGKIELVRAAFHNIPLSDNSVDALISVSAIEHADKVLLNNNIMEMKRIVKKGGPLLITTSATELDKDVFHEKTKGWCFSSETIKKMADNEQLKEMNFRKTEKDFLQSKLWLSRIYPYYTQDSKSEFYKRRIKRLPYFSKSDV